MHVSLLLSKTVLLVLHWDGTLYSDRWCVKCPARVLTTLQNSSINEPKLLPVIVVVQVVGIDDRMTPWIVRGQLYTSFGLRPHIANVNLNLFNSRLHRANHSKKPTWYA